jgi:hypothetical protein
VDMNEFLMELREACDNNNETRVLELLYLVPTGYYKAPLAVDCRAPTLSS